MSFSYPHLYFKLHIFFVWNGPFKICNFFRRVLNNGVWVNFRRWQTGMTVDPFCLLCGEEPKTISHLFCDCSKVRPLWSQLVHTHHQTTFFASDFRPWLLKNLRVAVWSQILALFCGWFGPWEQTLFFRENPSTCTMFLLQLFVCSSNILRVEPQ